MRVHIDSKQLVLSYGNDTSLAFPVYELDELGGLPMVRLRDASKVLGVDAGPRWFKVGLPRRRRWMRVNFSTSTAKLLRSKRRKQLATVASATQDGSSCAGPRQC